MGLFNFLKKNHPIKDMVKNNLNGIELEKSGKIDDAIKLYEYNVEHRFDGSHPYNRLAIIYRKQKEYEKEIIVLKQAIDVFTNDVPHSRLDRNKKIEEFNKRLKKVNELLQKKLLASSNMNTRVKSGSNANQDKID